MPKTFTLKNRARPIRSRNAYCMDITGNSRKENAPVIVYPCHKGPNQKFLYNRKTQQIRGAYSKKCIDISSNNRIIQRKCNSRAKTQKWKRSRGHWKSLHNNKCIDVEGGHYENGKLITWKCHNGSNQQFTV